MHQDFPSECDSGNKIDLTDETFSRSPHLILKEQKILPDLLLHPEQKVTQLLF